MDFMKVVDQAVREIKREVNIKVLKVPEIEQKVLDATSNEPWGPHGTALVEIAQATKKFTECQLIMNVLWTRLTDSGRNWRHVYKALAVIEYLIGNGSERVVDDIIEHSFQISSLSGFEYVEPNGKDMGINVRKKVETIMTLLNNKDKIEEVRNKASANRDKYIGLSSSGMSYKASSASYGSSSFYRDDHYGGFGGTKDGEMYKSRDRYDDDTDWNHGKRECFGRDGHDRSRLQSSLSHQDEESTSKKESTYCASRDKDDSYGPISSTQSSSAPLNNTEDDFEDFDPRASSATGSAAGRPNQVNLFGESLIGDLMDAPVPITTTTTNGDTSTDVDLFADATYVSASHNLEEHDGSHTQASVDLFASSAFPAASSSTVYFFAAADSSLPAEIKPSKPETMSTSMVDPFAAPVKPETTSTSTVDPFAAPSKPETMRSSMVDPFAAMPLNNFEGSDLFGDFASHTAPASEGQLQKSAGEGISISNQNISKEAKTTSKKDTFQVKSGIWADSLSRGLIDLNISAPKKVSLADIGIVGGLGDGMDEKEKGLPASTYGMGRAMGAGSGMGKSGFTSSSGGMGMGGDGRLSKLNQYDFGSFK